MRVYSGSWTKPADNEAIGRSSEMKLQTTLLDHWQSWGAHGTAFHATHIARGLYSTSQFVLRLSPEVHRQLEKLPSGIQSGHVDFEVKQAFSTYLHETIHWWQHVGSSYGLMLSLSYPAQMQGNYGHLTRLLAQIGFKKPLRRFIEQAEGPTRVDTPLGIANIIVHNQFDIETFRRLSLIPKRADTVVTDPLFECVGHAYHIALANNVVLLSNSADPSYSVLQHPRSWESGFDKVKHDREKGFYYGSPVTLAPIGAYEIFEGQARFAQLQYLHFATNGQFQLSDAAEWGMLNGVYGEAFAAFLQLTGIAQPASIDDPAVALFLLICDLAMNPSAGFPGPLVYHATFVVDVDPGMRFLFLCRMVATRCQHLANAIRDYSAAEYEAVSTELSSVLKLDPPLDVLRSVCSWRGASEGIRQLMKGYETFNFGPANTLPRVLLSHFIAYAEDKCRQPEFFCWPGAWMAGTRASDQSARLFDRHGALFVDKPDNDGVFPRLRVAADEAAIKTTFESFYNTVVIYELTRQWITASGPFEYDFRWLTQHGSDAELKAYADAHFSAVYGVQPDAAQVLT